MAKLVTGRLAAVGARPPARRVRLADDASDPNQLEKHLLGVG